SPPSSALPRATACGPRCSPACSPRCAITFSSCRRSTLSPSPIRSTSRPSSSSSSWRWWCRTWRRPCAPTRSPPPTAPARPQRPAPTRRARTTEALYVFSRKLAGVGTLDDVLWATAYQTALMLGVRVVLLLPDNGTISVKAGYPPEDTLDEADLAAAHWAWEN